jgi:hypothetical protein
MYNLHAENASSSTQKPGYRNPQPKDLDQKQILYKASSDHIKRALFNKQQENEKYMETKIKTRKS